MLRQGTGGFLVFSYSILHLGVKTMGKSPKENRNHADDRVDLSKTYPSQSSFRLITKMV